MVFCELTNQLSSETRSTRAGYHFVNGRIGLYKNPSYSVGEYDGSRGMIKNQDGDMSSYSEEDLERIDEASEWLRENNRIYRDRAPVLVGGSIPVVREKIRKHQQKTHVDVNRSAFQEELLMPVYEGGPRTADEENSFERLVFGVDDTRNLVKYGNPRLMGYLFPSLYVEGKGFYSLDYKGIMNAVAEEMDIHEGNMRITIE
jgi:hypothetical protein